MAVAAVSTFMVFAGPAIAQSVPTPRQHFGFDIGEDRKLADWNELTSYFEQLAATSSRVVVDTLGPTTVGNPFEIGRAHV